MSHFLKRIPENRGWVLYRCGKLMGEVGCQTLLGFRVGWIIWLRESVQRRRHPNEAPEESKRVEEAWRQCRKRGQWAPKPDDQAECCNQGFRMWLSLGVQEGSRGGVDAGGAVLIRGPLKCFKQGVMWKLTYLCCHPWRGSHPSLVRSPVLMIKSWWAHPGASFVSLWGSRGGEWGEWQVSPEL